MTASTYEISSQLRFDFKKIFSDEPTGVDLRQSLTQINKQILANSDVAWSLEFGGDGSTFTPNNTHYDLLAPVQNDQPNLVFALFDRPCGIGIGSKVIATVQDVFLLKFPAWVAAPNLIYLEGRNQNLPTNIDQTTAIKYYVLIAKLNLT